MLGEVQKPGVYPVLGARTLFDVLSLAGGTTPKAGKVVSITHRDNPQEPISVSLSNDAAQSVHSNVAIYPGDTIVVSKAGIVYIVGDVHRPSGVPMENGSMTVLQAIAMAEGTNPTAKLNGAKLIRKSAQGPQEMPLALKDMLCLQVPRHSFAGRRHHLCPNQRGPRAPASGPWKPSFRRPREWRFMGYVLEACGGMCAGSGFSFLSSGRGIARANELRSAADQNQAVAGMEGRA